MLSPGIGARTVQAVAMVAEVVHGAPYRFADPARFSFAHGGKDRHPFPVPLRVYDETIRLRRSAVQHAKLGGEEELTALKRLDDQARRLERHAAARENPGGRGPPRQPGCRASDARTRRSGGPRDAPAQREVWQLL